MTFTTSPGNDAVSSGITLKEMWVGRIDGYTEAEMQAGGFLTDCGNRCLCRFVV